VRKRVIKILRDICLQYPSYEKVPQICMKIVRRINDMEESVRKLVQDVFESLWFTPTNDPTLTLKKVHNITEVVQCCAQDLGTEWLQTMLLSVRSVFSLMG